MTLQEAKTILISIQNQIYEAFGKNVVNDDRTISLNRNYEALDAAIRVIDKQISKKPTITNYERITTMSVEEMAEYIVHNINPCAYCVYNGKDHSNGYDCYEGVQKYLESEVQENDT